MQNWEQANKPMNITWKITIQAVFVTVEIKFFFKILKLLQGS